MAKIADFADWSNVNIDSGWEPKQQNRFILQLEGSLSPALIVEASRPKINFGEVKLQGVNNTRKYKGKVSYDDINFKVVDIVSPSAAQEVEAWIRMSHDDSAGVDAYKKLHTQNVLLQLLGPSNDIVEEWVLHSSWLKTVDYGSLTKSDSGVINISCTLTYDYYELNY